MRELERTAAGNLQVLGICTDSKARDGKAWAEKNGITYPNVDDYDLAISDMYSVHGTPILILVHEGKVVARETSLTDDFRAQILSAAGMP